jgi:glutamate synthase domain-containing protein 1
VLDRQKLKIYDKDIGACSIFGAMNTDGRVFAGDGVIKAIANMYVRANGLGGGFAIYGIYPDYNDCYALHLMFESDKAKKDVDCFLNTNFDIIFDEAIPTNDKVRLPSPPIMWRYFVLPKNTGGISHDDYIVRNVMYINTKIPDAYVFSSGKNMGVFKGLGYPEDVARYFMLDAYRGYIWVAHGRFPTNTQGWWGGAHPLGILDCTVAHNGEISSYGTNRRYLEMHGYHCTLHTDTEVMAYAVDLLMRKRNLPLKIIAEIFAPPVWEVIEHEEEKRKRMLTILRRTYPDLLMNGPFSVIIAHHGEMIGLTDRIRLRPLTVGVKGDMTYLSSEESAIRLISDRLDQVWTPDGGEPVIIRLKMKEDKEDRENYEIVSST